MEHQVVTLNQPFDDVIKLIPKAIEKISGNVKKKEDLIFFWAYQVGIHEIQCESSIAVVDESTRVRTTAFSTTRKGSLAFLLTKFNDELSQDNGLDNLRKSSPPRKKSRRIKGSAEDREENYLRYILIGLVVFAVGFGIFDNIDFDSSSESDSYSNSNSSSLSSDKDDHEGYYTIEGYYGAYNKKDFDLLMRMMANGDEEGFRRMYRGGRVVVIPNNEKAYLVESTWSGSVRIRLEGRPNEIWTVKEAIEK